MTLVMSDHLLERFHSIYINTLGSFIMSGGHLSDVVVVLWKFAVEARDSGYNHNYDPMDAEFLPVIYFSAITLIKGRERGKAILITPWQ